ncbi:MAG: hypothetical protein LLG16_01470 [Euryarchaeota archaeon]|nr:hypothetical protein [Euryarchaeota archaeon]
MRRDQVSQELNVCYDPEGFRASVQQELDHELALLSKAKRPFKEGLLMHSFALILLGISGAIIYFDSQALYLWLFIGLLLYSYNFLTLLNPSTTIKPRPKELSELREQGKDDRWMVIRLLLKKRKLAIEIGLTVFLVGNIPSFFHSA